MLESKNGILGFGGSGFYAGAALPQHKKQTPPSGYDYLIFLTF
jgi:hypothetical protein